MIMRHEFPEVLFVVLFVLVVSLELGEADGGLGIDQTRCHPYILVVDPIALLLLA